MTAHANHVLQMVREYGGLIRQECQFHALGRSGDPIAAAQHKINADNDRRLQATYYAAIADALDDWRPEPDPIVMPPTVTDRIANALKGIRR